jgi:hypothetical protein
VKIGAEYFCSKTLSPRSMAVSKSIVIDLAPLLIAQPERVGPVRVRPQVVSSK